MPEFVLPDNFETYPEARKDVYKRQVSYIISAAHAFVPPFSGSC